MIDIKYFDHWNKNLNFPFQNFSCINDRSLEHGNVTPLNSSFKMSDNSLLIKTIIEVIFSNFDREDCLYGFFNALGKSKNQITPFLAAHNYCIKIQSFNSDGTIHFNISPIYYLGPEYPHEYKLKHGTDLNSEAIIGLIELPISQNELEMMHHENTEYKTFRLGIDAGIVFNNSAISHNKQMNLHIKQINDGIMVDLCCEGQATSKKFTWQELGIVYKNEQQKMENNKYNLINDL